MTKPLTIAPYVPSYAEERAAWTGQKEAPRAVDAAPVVERKPVRPVFGKRGK